MSDPLRDSVARIAGQARPELRYSYPRTYVVRAARSDGTLDLDPPADDAGKDLPPLDRVEQWTLGGALAFPAAGASVVVAFRDATETRPIVVGFAPGTPIKIVADASGEIDLGAAIAPAAREGDQYILGTATGVLTRVSLQPTPVSRAKV